MRERPREGKGDLVALVENKTMKGKNYNDQIAEGMVEAGRYVDASVSYPDLEKVKPDAGVVAEWLYPALNGKTDAAELKAILLYTTQNVVYDEELGNLFLGIAFVEMQHYDKLSEAIHKLGGRISGAPNTITVNPGKDREEALRIAIASENSALEFYNRLYQKLDKLYLSPTVKTIMALVDKIRKDEVVHLRLLREKLKEDENIAE